MTYLNTNYGFPKEHLRIVSRFLKEVGLYACWIRFLYSNDKKNTINWGVTTSRTPIEDVLGETNFTAFLDREFHKRLPRCVSGLFKAFLLEYHREYFENKYWKLQDAKDIRQFLDIDKDKKKIRILYKK